MTCYSVIMKKKPKNPGILIKNQFLKRLEISITQAAESLKISRQTLSLILNGKLRISPSMAIRLSIAFNTTAEFWLILQMEYDLFIANKKKFNIKPLIKRK